MSELKLNLDGVEGGITEAVAPSVTSFSSSSLLPSVKGSTVDYVHANRDSASQLGLHRRLETMASKTKQEKPVAGKLHRRGSVPKYLTERKEAERQRRAAEKAVDPDCPLGHFRLEESDRAAALDELNSRFEALLKESLAIPVSADTLRVRERRRRVEEQLNELEEAIKAYSRQKVYVKQKGA